MEPRTPYRILFLDADGTLFDYEAAEAKALEVAFREVSGSYDARYLPVYREINDAIWRELERRRITQAALAVERFKRLERRLGVGLVEEEIGRLAYRYLDALADESRLLPDADRVVGLLAAHHRLALVTNGLARVQRPRVQRSTIASSLAACIISDEVGVAKPNARILEIACETLGVPVDAASRRNMLIVGDSLSSDVAAGRAFGIDTCWYNPHGAPVPTAPAPTYVIRELGELPAIARYRCPPPS
jgi:putative hydrolase of the HAD superfamily